MYGSDPVKNYLQDMESYEYYKGCLESAKIKITIEEVIEMINFFRGKMPDSITDPYAKLLYKRCWEDFYYLPYKPKHVVVTGLYATYQILKKGLIPQI